MPVLRRTAFPLEGSSDPLWWCLAASLGLLSLWLPQLLSLEAVHVTEVAVVESALFISGAALGCLNPRRVWRWGAAALIAFALRDVIHLLTDPKFAGATVYLHVLTQLGDNSPMYLVQCLPVLAGAYIGYFVSTAGLR
jgi:hypothetical protein